MAKTELKRNIGLGLLVFYGVGVMVGAGVYVLIGAVAGAAGIYAPVAFMLAGVVAAPTALAYSELSSRIPEAAGEAAYVEASFRRAWLVALIGFVVVLVGAVSAGTVMRGGVGYLGGIVNIDPVVASLLLGFLLIAVAIWGAFESLAVAAFFTIVEVLGLVVVSAAGLIAEPSVDWVQQPSVELTGISAGAVLAFFAFIGFEDMVNMAEETHEPQKTMPKAIIISLLVTTLLYALVSYAAVRTVSITALANNEQPLALLWEESTGRSAAFLSLIAVVAAMNGILAQMVMASRVLMGLGRRYNSMRWLARVYPRFGTPALATLLIGVVVIVISVLAPVKVLAEITSSLLLLVFIIINASLLILKRQSAHEGFSVPQWVPLFGCIASAAALLGTLLLD